MGASCTHESASIQRHDRLHRWNLSLHPSEFQTMCAFDGARSSVRLLCVPEFYILSTSKTSDASWDMIHCVVQATDQQLKPAQVVCDFEPALINAVQTQLPNAEVIGCLFHFKEAIRRGMKRPAISVDEASVAMTPGVLDMLTVVEPSKVANQGILWVTEEIKKRCKDASYRYSKLKWQALWRYFRKIWIERYSPEVWNIHGIATRFATPHPSMAVFVGVIKQISGEYVAKLADVSCGRSRRKVREIIQLPKAVSLPSDDENMADGDSSDDEESVSSRTAQLDATKAKENNSDDDEDGFLCNSFAYSEDDQSDESAIV